MGMRNFLIFAVLSIVVIVIVKSGNYFEGIDEAVNPPQVQAEAKTEIIKEPKPVKEEKRKTPISGENAKITEDMPVAVSKESLDEMINYINANNKEALGRMALRGEFFKVNKGDRVTVVKSGFLSSEVEVIETGQRGFVPNEFIIKE